MDVPLTIYFWIVIKSYRCFACANAPWNDAHNLTCATNLSKTVFSGTSWTLARWPQSRNGVNSKMILKISTQGWQESLFVKVEFRISVSVFRISCISYISNTWARLTCKSLKVSVQKQITGLFTQCVYMLGQRFVWNLGKWIILGQCSYMIDPAITTNHDHTLSMINLPLYLDGHVIICIRRIRAIFIVCEWWTRKLVHLRKLLRSWFQDRSQSFSMTRKIWQTSWLG